MHRKFASWLVARPGRAVLATALLGMLPLLGLGFAFFLPGAVPALIVLERGSRQGLATALGATALLSAVIWLVGRPLPIGLIYSAWVLGPPLVLAWGLRRSESMSLCLQVSVLAGAAMLVVLHTAFGDPREFWAPFVRDLAHEMQRKGLPMDLEKEGLVETLAQTLWGWITVLTVLLAMFALFLARWWQQLLHGAQGAFGREFQGLRLGLVLGAAAVAACAVSVFTESVLADDLWRLFMGALVIVGLAAAHRAVAGGRLAGGWLWGIYLTLVFVAPVMVAGLAVWGFVDNWQRSRHPAATAA